MVFRCYTIELSHLRAVYACHNFFKKRPSPAWETPVRVCKFSQKIVRELAVTVFNRRQSKAVYNQKQKVSPCPVKFVSGFLDFKLNDIFVFHTLAQSHEVALPDTNRRPRPS
jgi:hypothetical protein